MTAKPPSAVAATGYRTLLHNRAYLTLLGSEMVMRLGQSLYLAILPWLLLEITGSDSAVGWATTATFLPYLLLSIPAGAFVDRVERRRLMMTVNLLGAAVTIAVPIFHVAGSLAGWHALLITFLLSALVLLFQLGRSCIIPLIVHREQLVTANATHVILTGLAMIAGNALVGPIVRTLGLANGLAVYAGALALSAGLLSRLALPRRDEQLGQGRHVQARDLLRGLSYVWHDRAIRSAFTLDTLYFVLADGLLMTGLPLFVRDVLRGGPEVYSYTRIAGNAGMLLGAWWLGQFGRSLPKGRVIVVAWLGYGLSLMAYPLLRSQAAAMVASFCAAMMGNLIPASGRSLLQERVPQGLLGRVFGVWAIIAPGAGTLSGLLGGTLAGLLPAGTLVALGATVPCINAFLGRISGLWQEGVVRAAGQAGNLSASSHDRLEQAPAGDDQG